MSEEKRDYAADLAFCEKATPAPVNLEAMRRVVEAAKELNKELQKKGSLSKHYGVSQRLDEALADLEGGRVE